MRTLKEFLEVKEVKEGIRNNIEPFKISESKIEMKLYHCNNMYLVEIRIFNGGKMDNAYLDIFNDNMEHLEGYVDDVWSFADWEVLESKTLKTVVCMDCGHEFEPNYSKIRKDVLGWYTHCLSCGSSFDIDISELLIPNGTTVTWDGKVGIVDGNDEETTEDFENINYYFCPIEYTNEDVWCNHYVMLRRCEIEIL